MKKIKKNVKVTKQEKRPVNTKLMIIVSSVIAVFLVGGILFDYLNKVPILTINKNKYEMSDLGYYFYSVESKYDYYNKMFGGSYWDMTVDKTKGTTIRDQAKTEAVNTALSTEVLYKEAMKKGYKLTTKEKETVDTNVKSLINGQITKPVQLKNNFTKSYLSGIVKKETLVNRYRQDIIDSFNIDDKKITAGVSKEDNRQYNIEYFFISTKKTDKDGNAKDMTSDEKSAAFEKINALTQKAKDTKDWSTLVPSGETDLTYSKGSFTEKDTSSSFSEDFRDKMKKMANNDVSEIYPEANGYYLVRMLDNNSTESYDKAVKQAITDAENTEFEKYYQKVLKNYKYVINNKALENYTMGEITLTY